jgi:hypothetical protein
MEGLRGIRLYVSDRRGAYRQRSKKEVKAIVNRKYADRAVVILAARAAVEAGGFVSADGRPISTSKFKAGYRYDEERLKVIARTLRVAEFTAWRRQMLKRARDIVSIPHISRSILWVAVILEHELTMHEMKLGNGLVSAQKVREALRGGRELSAACSGGVVRRNSDQHRRPAP